MRMLQPAASQAQPRQAGAQLLGARGAGLCPAAPRLPARPPACTPALPSPLSLGAPRSCTKHRRGEAAVASSHVITTPPPLSRPSPAISPSITAARCATQQQPATAPAALWLPRSLSVPVCPSLCLSVSSYRCLSCSVAPSRITPRHRSARSIILIHARSPADQHPTSRLCSITCSLSASRKLRVYGIQRFPRTHAHRPSSLVPQTSR